MDYPKFVAEFTSATRERFGDRHFRVQAQGELDGLLVRLEMPPMVHGWAIPNHRLEDEQWRFIHDHMLCEITDEVLARVPYAWESGREEEHHA